MEISGWRHLRGVDPGRLSDARLHAHYAIQWPARAARAFIPAQRDDSHANLGWKAALNGFETLHLPDASHLGLNIAELSLVFSAAGFGAKRAACSLRGRSDAQVGLWVREQISAKALNAGLLDHPSPYALPDHAIARGGAYTADNKGGVFTELADWFANAEMALGVAHKQILAAGLAAPAPRLWPHHFDLATLTSFPISGGTQQGWVGAGFSPGDHYYDEPYFYVSIYPAIDEATLPALPPIGHWHSHEFMAAVATAGKIVAAPDPQAAVAEFLEFAITAAISALRHRAAG